MKIAFVGLKGLPAKYGGVQRFVEEISTRLVDKGNDVTAYSRTYYTPAHYSNYKGIKIVRVKGVKSRLGDTISHTLLSIFKAIKKDYDIIAVVNLGNAWLALIPKILGKKVVCHLRALEWEQRDKWNMLERLFFYSCIYALKLFSIPTTTNYPLHHQLLKSRYKFSAEYISNGINKNNGVAPVSMYQELYAADSFILCVSRLVPQKGVEYLIDAYLEIDTEKKLLIAGETVNHEWYKNMLFEKAKNDSKIVFLGPVQSSDLIWLYRSAYLSVLPSETEGMPNVLLENIANEVAIIASDIEIHKILTNNKVEYFPSKNSGELKQILENVLFSVEERNKLKAHAKILKNNLPSWDNVTDRYQEFYSKALNN